jgi:hypothetical protein
LLSFHQLTSLSSSALLLSLTHFSSLGSLHWPPRLVSYSSSFTVASLSSSACLPIPPQLASLFLLSLPPYSSSACLPIPPPLASLFLLSLPPYSSSACLPIPPQLASLFLLSLPSYSSSACLPFLLSLPSYSSSAYLPFLLSLHQFSPHFLSLASFLQLSSLPSKHHNSSIFLFNIFPLISSASFSIPLLHIKPYETDPDSRLV